MPGDVRALHQRTEGWAAGLYLAGLSLRGRPDATTLIRAFAGTDRQIVDYLVTEVMDGQPAHVRSFLLRTSVLDRFCGPLCDAVTAGSGSQRILEDLERSNLFVVPLDTGRWWYRYHHLFAELLRHELDRAEPGLAPLLHRRASAWHRQHGSIAEAISHAMEAAEAGSAQGPLTEWPASIQSAACMLRAGYRHMIGDLAGAESASRQAVALEAAGTPRWRAVASATLGAILCWRGRDSEARTILEEVARPVHPPANNLASLWALGCLAAIAVRQGNLETAEDHLKKAMELAAEHGLGEYWVTAMAVLTSAELLQRRGQLAGAEAAALSGLRLAERGQARLETAYAQLSLARVRSRTGSGDEARTRVSATRRIITACADPGMILTELLASTERDVGQHAPQPRPGPYHPAEPLSERESEILRWLNSQLSLREIASELYVSYYTVKTHTRHIYRKLGVSTRQQAVARARGDDAR